MPYRRFLRTRAPIKTDKHEITWSNLGQDAGTSAINVTLAKGVDSADKDSSVECEIGSHVKAIFLEFHFSAAQTGNANVIHWKVHVLRPAQTATNPNTYYQTERSQIIKRGMEMLPVNVSTVFKRIIVVRIPKIYQRMRDSSEIRFSYQASSTQTINACGIGIYKEIY